MHTAVNNYPNSILDVKKLDRSKEFEKDDEESFKCGITSRGDLRFRFDKQNVPTRCQSLKDNVRFIAQKMFQSNISRADRNLASFALQRVQGRYRLNPARISTSSRLYLGHHKDTRNFRGKITFRDPRDFISQVGHVAIKLIADDVRECDIRQELLQKVLFLHVMNHTCILKFHGAYWSHTKTGICVGGNQGFKLRSNSAFIVTELMIYNLRTALDQGFSNVFKRIPPCSKMLPVVLNSGILMA